MSSLEIEVVPSILEIDETDWNALVDVDRDSPFLDHRFLATLERTRCVGPESGWIPSHLVARRDGRIAGIAPAYVKDNSEGEFVYDFAWADLYQRVGLDYYPKVVLAIPFTPASGSRFLVAPGEKREELIQAFAYTATKLAEEIAGSSAHVLFPREGEVEVLAKSGFLRRYGVQYHFRNPGFSSFEDFLKTLPSKKRTQLRRERKEPARQRIAIRELGAAELDHHVDTVFELYASTIRKFPWQKRYLSLAFFREIVRVMPEHLSVILAEREGKAIAGAFNVKSRTTLFGRYWGTTEEVPFLHFNVCYYDGVERCIAEKRTLFEPGAGGEHKRVRGFIPTVTHSAHFIASPRLRGILADYLLRERDAILAYVASGGRDEEPET